MNTPKPFALGKYHRYMILDATGTSLRSPVQDTNLALFLGSGPEIPLQAFWHDRKHWSVREVLGSDDRLNPFDCPLVVAERT